MVPHSIYVVTNRNNGKVYVGKTSETPEKRWRRHVSESHRNVSRYLYSAIRKHGEDAFDVREVATGANENGANCLEKLWIQTLRSSDPGFGYNLTLGGDGMLGHKASAETLSKKRGQKHIHTPEGLAQVVAANKRRAGEKHGPLSEEHKAVLKALWTPERKESMKAKVRGWWASEASELLREKHAARRRHG